ncbi:MAG: hypothetical protein O2973_01810 [Gemmatimonadetes bacterium]|nr:hypothetical protein [Gemmatimonadota bacterium]
MSRFRRSVNLAAFTLLAASTLFAQGGQPEAPQPAPVNAATNPALRGFSWRAIGPIGQGGRVDDIAVVESDPQVFYVGFATAGVWKTSDNGINFAPIFDTYSTHSIGDIAIAPSNPDVVYVGTGEPNNRQSSSFGDGVFKTTDGGKTFTNVGLRETQSIARVVVHPTNPDIVWVAANGHLFGSNPERGVFKTTNGGRTWQHVLAVDENTGATDIVIHPTNPNILFAATYTRRRTVFGFASGGPGSGIWRSTNGGSSWSRVTGNGLPAGTMGRIGLDFARSNPDVIYAQIEVAPDKEPVDAAALAAAGRGGRGGGGGGFGQQEQPSDDKVSGIWRSNNGGRTWAFQSNQNNRPMYYSQIRVDPSDENTVYVGGASPAKSTDGAKTFTQLTGFGHGDHHAIWINPRNSRHVMYGNDGSLDISYDGAETWESIRTWAVGQPYHASVDMRRPYYVCAGLQDNGTWCGPSSVRSGPILAQDWYRVGGGDGFYTAVDPTDFLTMYAESQDGNMNRVDLRNGTSTSIRPRPGSRSVDTPPPGGGGGGRGGRGGSPTVFPETDEPVSVRFNWNTPLVLSPHDPSTVYVAGNRLFISRDRGATWRMTDDLTKGLDRQEREIAGMKGTLPGCSRARVGQCIMSKNDGTSMWGTAVSFGESAVVPGVLWVGTDDGHIQVSRDNGATWTEVGKNVPGGTKEYYISRIEPSHFDAATAYASVDGHKSDDLKPYVFVTRNYGETWTSITSNLPDRGNVNTIRQDPRNRNLLYAGTEFGFFVSLDEGRTWSKFMTGLPVVRVDDVLVHPRDNDLVLATHGRSVQVMDDITALQQMTPEAMAQDVVLFEPRNAVAWKNDMRMSRNVPGAKNFRGETAPRGSAISYYLKSVPAGAVTLTIRDVATGAEFRTLDATKLQGLNRIQWDLCSDVRPIDPAQGFGGFGGGGGGCFPPGGGRGGGRGGAPAGVAQMASPGSFSVTLTVGGRNFSKSLTVLEDIWMEQR